MLQATQQLCVRFRPGPPLTLTEITSPLAPITFAGNRRNRVSPALRPAAGCQTSLSPPALATPATPSAAAPPAAPRACPAPAFQRTRQSWGDRWMGGNTQERGGCVRACAREGLYVKVASRVSPLQVCRRPCMWRRTLTCRVDMVCVCVVGMVHVCCRYRGRVS